MARTRISPYGWVIIFFLFGLGAINFADKAVLGLAAVPIIKELHLSPSQYGLVSGSLFWLFSLLSVLVTAWSDRIGTKKVLALLATTWAIVQIATVFVFSFPALLLTRVVLGAGEGPSYGTSVSAATPWLPADRRAFGLAVVSFGSAIGPAVFAPPLTFVIVVVGWRAAFALLGGIGMLWVILWRCTNRLIRLEHCVVCDSGLLNCITHFLSLFLDKELKAESIKLRENDSNRTGRKNRGEPLTRFLKCMRGYVNLVAYGRRERRSL